MKVGHRSATIVKQSIKRSVSALRSTNTVANKIDLTAVGALTSSNTAFKFRPWETEVVDTIDLTDGCGSNIYAHLNEYGVQRCLPKKNREINDCWISDKARFSMDALKHMRVEEIPNKEALKKINESCNDKTLILVSHETDMVEYRYLKNLQYTSKGKIQVKVFSTSNESGNFVSWGNKNKTYDIVNGKSESCYIFSSNPKTEAVVLNSRLRHKFINTNISFEGTGFNSDVYSKSKMGDISYVRLNINHFLGLLQNKVNVQSSSMRNIIKQVNPIFLFGRSLENRLSPQSMEAFMNILKIKIPTSLVYTVQTSCNTEGLKYCNSSHYNTSDINSKTRVFAFNLDDTIHSRKMLKHAKNNNNVIVWGNSHQSDVSNTNNDDDTKWCDVIFPLLCSQERNGLYMNMEQRPQKHQQLTYPHLTEMKSVDEVVRMSMPDICTNQSMDWNSKELSAVSEAAANTSVYAPPSYKLVDMEQCSPYMNNGKYGYSTYPLKAVVENFYQTNVLTRNSVVMAKTSRALRQ